MVVAIISLSIGLVIGYYFGLKNYSFSPRERNVIEIEVQTDIAMARLNELKREALHVSKVIEKLRPL